MTFSVDSSGSYTCYGRVRRVLYMLCLPPFGHGVGAVTSVRHYYLRIFDDSILAMLLT